MPSRLVFHLSVLLFTLPWAACDTGGGPASRCTIQEGRTFRQNAELRSLAGCPEVVGHLSIASPDVTDLSPLAGLEGVSGHLKLIETGVVHLDALRALRHVGGDLRVESNARLTRVDGLSALESVEGDVLLSDNEALESLEGWSACATVGQGLTISRNNALAGIRGFERLQQMQSLEVTDNPRLIEMNFDAPTLPGLSALTLSRNNRLLILKGLGGIQDVDVLVLSNNPVLSRLEILFHMTSAGHVTLSDLPALAEFAGLRNLAKVRGRFLLAGSGMATPQSLQSLREVGDRFELRENLVFRGFRHHNQFFLPRVGGGTGNPAEQGIYLIGNPAMRELEGFNFAKVINGTVWIENNESLSTLFGMGSATEIGSLVIRNNAALSDLGELRALRSVGVLSLSGNLTSLEGLSSLTRVRELRLEGLPRLKTLRGLEKLTELEGSLTVSASALTSLTGLDSLARFGGTLTIAHCGALERLTGLGALFHPGLDLRIHDNPRLPACEAEALLQWLRQRGLQGPGDVRDNTGTGTCP